ncbi:MAG: ABC transporter ATP-binding protein [Bacillota bacterium]
MRKFLKYAKPYWYFFAIAPMLMLVEVWCDVQIPSYSADIVNLGVASGEITEIYKYMAMMVGTAVLAVCCGVSGSFFSSRASVNFCCDLREDLFSKIQEFSFNNIDEFSTGSLVTRLTNDITQMQTTIVLALRMIFRAPGMLIGAIYMAWQINPSISTIYMCIFPVLISVIFLVLYYSYKKFSLLQIKIDGINIKIREILTNVRVIKGFTRENHENDEFETVNGELRGAGLAAYRITIMQLPIMTLVVNMASVVIIYVGSVALGKNEILVGDISAFLTYLTQILFSVNMLTNVFLQGSRAIISAKRVSEILDCEVDITDIFAKYKEKEVEKGDIEFRNVSFKYYKDNTEKVLSDVSLKINGGETVGIIGSTGSGKTSLVNMIPRLYDADSGAILVDGVDVRDYALKNLRDGVSVVLQQNSLFTGTISENLHWGDMEASDEEIRTVANWAQAHSFILEKEDGYDEWVDQGGVNFSGGQKQRLCIARALLKKPKILILDDSMSAVDTATEHAISEHLKNELAGTTKIIIAQRITSVVDADNIFVMNDGKIEASGTHSELLKTSQTYREIFESQTGKEVSEHGC